MEKTDSLTRSLVLALGVCYHARLQERTDFEEGVVAKFTKPLALPGGAQQFRHEIKRCTGYKHMYVDLALPSIHIYICMYIYVPKDNSRYISSVLLFCQMSGSFAG